MKLCKFVQQLLVGDTDRQTGDLVSLLSFLESRQKEANKKLCCIDGLPAVFLCPNDGRLVTNLMHPSVAIQLCHQIAFCVCVVPFVSEEE
jgi:hypothetical protein